VPGLFHKAVKKWGLQLSELLRRDKPMTALVLGIEELLVHILLSLPLHTLLLSQRVCWRWRQTIQGNRKIRQALFLDPLQSLLGTSSKDDMMLVNPLFDRFLTYNGTRYSREIPGWRGQTIALADAITAPSSEFVHELQKSHETASWREMILMQTDNIFQTLGNYQGIAVPSRPTEFAIIRDRDNAWMLEDLMRLPAKPLPGVFTKIEVHDMQGPITRPSKKGFPHLFLDNRGEFEMFGYVVEPRSRLREGSVTEHDVLIMGGIERQRRQRGLTHPESVISDRPFLARSEVS
jgi:hypothetical protein